MFLLFSSFAPPFNQELDLKNLSCRSWFELPFDVLLSDFVSNFGVKSQFVSLLEFHVAFQFGILLSQSEMNILTKF
jgi:hypothetical protein